MKPFRISDMEQRVEFSLFRQLLQLLEDADTVIRLRISGEGWMGSSKVILVSDSAMIVQTNDNRRVILNLHNVVEFELEESLLTLAAHQPYEVMY